MARGKGGAFERVACVELSKWWSKKGEDDLFWRTHGSGNRATVRGKAGRNTRGQYGDVAAVDSRGAIFIKAFTISLKRGYAGISLQDVMDQFEKKKTPSQFEIWIKECLRDHHASGSLGWLLILRKNRRRALVFMPSQFLFYFDIDTKKELMNATPCAFFRMGNGMGPKRLASMSSRRYARWWLRNNCGVFGLRLEDFLRIVQRVDIIDIVKRYGNV